MSKSVKDWLEHWQKGDNLPTRPHDDLTATERQLLADLIDLARRLDKRGVLGVYRIAGEIAEAVRQRQAQGLEAIALISHGLDMTRAHEAKQIAARRERLSKAIGTNADIGVCVAFGLVLAFAALLFGVAGYPFGYYAAALLAFGSAVTAIFAFVIAWID